MFYNNLVPRACDPLEDRRLGERDWFYKRVVECDVGLEQNLCHIWKIYNASKIITTFDQSEGYDRSREFECQVVQRYKKERVRATVRVVAIFARRI